MRTRLACAALAIAGALALIGYGFGHSPAPAPVVRAAAHYQASPPACPLAAVSCTVMPDAGPGVGQFITDSRAGTGTPWLVTDHNTAPMAWVNLFGLYSGGDGGKMPGGLICVTYGTARTVACLTPEGTLQLTPTGPHGPTGPTQTLTARDLRFLHRLEHRG